MKLSIIQTRNAWCYASETVAKARVALDACLLPILTSMHFIAYVSQMIAVLELSALIWTVRKVIDLHIQYTQRQILMHFVTRGRHPFPSPIVPGLSVAFSTTLLFLSMAWPCYILAWNTELLLEGNARYWVVAPVHFSWITAVHRAIIKWCLNPIHTEKMKQVFSSVKQNKLPLEIQEMILQHYDRLIQERNASIDACFQAPQVDDKSRSHHIDFLKRTLQTTMAFCILVIFGVVTYVTYQSHRTASRFL